MGRTSGGFKQAVGIRTKREWCRHSMSREKLVEISGKLVQADLDGGAKALVEGQEVYGKLGRMDWAQCGGHRLEGEGKGATEGNGEGSGKNRWC